MPIEAVIQDLGRLVPADAIDGDVPPPPSCEPKGATCVQDSECCSNKCRGAVGGKSCK